MIQRSITHGVARHVAFACAALIMLSCQPKQSEQTAEADSASSNNGSEEEILRFEGTFVEILPFEGSCSVVFSDSEGNSVSFSNESSAIDMESVGLYTKEEMDGTPIPNYIVNSDAVGKKFSISYRVEYSDDNPAAEMAPFYILMEAKMLSN